MDRNKQVPGRQKGKLVSQPPDNTFIALGAKSSGSREIDPKWNNPLPKPAKNSSMAAVVPPERKRDSGSISLASSSGAQPPKKIKSSGPTVSTGSGSIMRTCLGSSSEPTPLSVSGVEKWESMAIDQEASLLFQSIMENVKNDNNVAGVGYILGGIRSMKQQRFKPCRVVYNALLLACQLKPTLFTNEHVIAAIVSIIRRDLNVGPKTPNKSIVYNHMLLINLLIRAFEDEPHWPVAFVKLYAEDAVADRMWIDNPYCKPFVDNIITAFCTKSPTRNLLASDIWMTAQRETGSPLTISLNDDDEAVSDHKHIVDTWNLKVYPRYSQSSALVEQIILETINEQVARRQQPDAITKNFVRFLSTTSGLVEIRVIAVARIETWLHNHKLMKPSQELLAYLCYNCSASTQRDIEVIASLSKLRLKNKPIVNFFNNCLKEMVTAVPATLCPLLKHTIYNELANSRNSNNLFVIGAMFQVLPEASAEAFADICIELFLNKDDYLRSLRALLKEITRVLRHDINLHNVVHKLLRERKDLLGNIQNSEFRERIFVSIADLVCMAMLLCVSPAVRDAATTSKRDPTILKAFQTQVSQMQREAIYWLHECIQTFRPSASEFQYVLHKILFLEQPEQYCKVDSWPGENDRYLFLRLASEVPLLQATLMRILLMGVTKDFPLPPNESLDVADQLIKRAANLNLDCMPPLDMDKPELLDFFFNLATYNYPENISLPIGYIPPSLAIGSLYWKGWLMLAVLAAHNPGTIGSWAWEKYPILRMFMEMCITNHFSYPPPSMPLVLMSSIDDLESSADTQQRMPVSLTTDEYLTKELQTAAIERQKILEFESHLAAASTKVEINDQTSLLLPTLMELQPLGGVRRPPQPILDTLQSLNHTHRLGHLLCRSRNPDFLVDIMSRAGSTGNMPWLAELVHNSEGALAHLPVQCLCEYLLSNAPAEKLTKHGQLLDHLRAVVTGAEPQNSCEILEYLLRRLTSLYSTGRAQAIKGLTLILAPAGILDMDHGEFMEAVNNTKWLTHYIQNTPHFQSAKLLIIQSLRQAVQVETNPTHMANYIEFLAANGMDENTPSDFVEYLIFDMASIIVERNSITSYILPGENARTLQALVSVFTDFLQRLRRGLLDFQWLENQDLVLVRWNNGETCRVQVLIVHASIILLTYGPIVGYEPFDILLDIWFPVRGEHPKAFLIDTNEEALLVPDWLKLRMIRSNVPQLLDAAVEKLEASQLVLFIQSFGIPVVSISKLLQVLDMVTVNDPKLVVDSVLDKNYMIQLVEVQNRRGATGGEIFVRALEMRQPPNSEVDDNPADKLIPQRHSLPTTTIRQRRRSSVLRMSGSSANDLFVHIQRVFDTANTNVAADVKIVSKIIATAPPDHLLTNQLLDFIQSIPVSMVVLMCLRENAAATLLRLLLERSYTHHGLKLAQNLMINLANEKRSPLYLSLKQYQDSAAQNMNIVMAYKVSENVKSALLEKPLNLGDALGRQLLINPDIDRTGLWVDWLCSVELEIASTSLSENMQQQMQLLFGPQSIEYRPLLMSVVLQRARWSTLNDIVDYLLTAPKYVEQICPKAALDFFSALVACPRLWQGRDKAVPKHARSENVLHLNGVKSKTLLHYILIEADSCANARLKCEQTIELRVPLFLQNVNAPLEPIIKWLSDIESDTSRYLLLILYMRVPHINLRSSIREQMSCSNKMYSSALDVTAHTLISALTVPNSKVKDWNRRSCEWELCTRKLAATHPSLFLRQLPMLSACLRGRAQYDWNVLRWRGGHFQLFTQIMGLLELLRPKIFKQQEQLCSLLDSYFLLIKSHGASQDPSLNILVHRLVEFIQGWFHNDSKSASQYIHSQSIIIKEVQHCQLALHTLVASISPVSQIGNGEQPNTSRMPVTNVPVMLPLQLQPVLKQPTFLIDSHVSCIQSALTSNALGNDSGLLLSLQKIEDLSSRRPHLLAPFSQLLFDCLSMSIYGACANQQQVRAILFTLIVRYLKLYPNACEEALPLILSCLDCSNPSAVNDVLERLPEFCIIMQEHAPLLMKRAFRLSTRAVNSCDISINKCILFLNLPNGV